MKKLAFFLISMVVLSCNTETEPKEIDWQGHRGARGVRPENSLEGFKYAIDKGIQTLELDVVLSGDGQVVVSHEPWMNRTICSHPKGMDKEGEKAYNLYRMTYDSIRQFDCGKLVNPRFPKQVKQEAYKPLLLEVIETCDEYARVAQDYLPRYNIEIKSDPARVGEFQPPVSVMVKNVVTALNYTQLIKQGRVTIQSFDVSVLKLMHAKFPEIPLVYLVENKPKDPNKLFEPLGFTPEIYSPQYNLIDQELMEFCSANKVKVIPWTVNDAEVAKKLIALGVHGIITDYPSLQEQL